MARKAHIGVQLHPQHATIDELRDAWVRADGLELDSIWTWDHFFPLYGDPAGEHFEGMSLLAAMAATTSHAQLGLMVTCNSYRNPELLADMYRTIDQISGGRVYLGIGSGWFERDYDEYGYPFLTARKRLAKLEEDLPRIKRRLAVLNPAPMGKLPILIGGSGEKVTLRLVAEQADAWNTFGPPELYAAKNAVLNEWCDKVGRPRTEVERTVCVGKEDIGRFDEYLDAGATHLIMMHGVQMPGGERTGFDFEALEALLAWAEG